MEFERLSHILAISAEIKMKAWQVWQEFSSTTDQLNLKDGFSSWLMLAIYTAVVDLRFVLQFTNFFKLRRSNK